MESLRTPSVGHVWRPRRLRVRPAAAPPGPAGPSKGYFKEVDPAVPLPALWGKETRDLISEKEEGEMLWRAPWLR